MSADNTIGFGFFRGAWRVGDLSYSWLIECTRKELEEHMCAPRKEAGIRTFYTEAEAMGWVAKLDDDMVEYGVTDLNEFIGSNYRMTSVKDEMNRV